MQRSDGSHPDELRPITFQRGFTKHAQGSVLVSFGDTRVLCTACVQDGVPHFLKGKGRGWVTAEYAMLPSSTHDRKQREKGVRVDGRSVEIQRLIGRSLRFVVDAKALTERTIWVDCDVLQADGQGTRTAAISGAWVALHDALSWMDEEATAPLLADGARTSGPSPSESWAGRPCSTSATRRTARPRAT